MLDILARSSEPYARRDLGRHCEQLAVTADGSQIVCGMGSGELQFLTRDLSQSVRTLRPGSAEILHLWPSPEGQYLTVGDHDASGHLVDLRSGQSRRFRPEGQAERCWSTALRRDGRWFVAGLNTGIVITCDLQTGRQYERVIFPDGRRWLPWVGFDPTEDYVYLLSAGGELVRTDLRLRNRTVVADWQTGGRESALRANSAWATPDGRVLFGGGSSHAWRYNFDTGQELTIDLPSNTTVSGVTISPNGKLGAVGTRKGHVLLYDVEAMELRYDLTLAPEGSVRGLAFAPDGKALVAVVEAGQLAAWGHAEVQPAGIEEASPLLQLQPEPEVELEPELEPEAEVEPVSARRVPRAPVRLRRLAGQPGPLMRRLLAGLEIAGLVEPGAAQADLGTAEPTVTYRPRALEQEPFAQTRVAESCNAAAFLHEGNAAAFGDNEGVVHLWRGDLSEKIGELRVPGESQPIQALQLAPDGRTLAVAHRRGPVRCWDLETQEHRELESPAPEVPIWFLAFRDDMQYLAAGLSGRRVVVWEYATGRVVLDATPSANWIRLAFFSPLDQSLVTAFFGEGLRFLNLATGQEERSVALPRGVRLNCACVSRDGRRVAGGSDRFWAMDLATEQELHPPRAVPGTIHRASFSPDGSWVALGLATGDVMIVDCEAFETRYQLQTDPTSLITGIDFHPQASSLLVVDETGEARLWRAEAAEVQAPVPSSRTVQGPAEREGLDLTPTHSIRRSAPGCAIAYARHDQMVVVGEEHGIKAYAADLSREQDLRSPLGEAEEILMLQPDPAGDHLAVGTVRGDVHLWDTASDEWRHFAAPPDAEGCWSVAFSADDRWLAASLGTGRVAVWNRDTAELQHTAELFGHWSPCCGFSADGQRLHAVSAAGEIKTIETATGTETFAGQLPGLAEAAPPTGSPETEVNAAAISRDGRYLVAGFRRGWVYDLEQQQAVAGPIDLGDLLEDVRLTPDGRLAAAVLRDGTLRLYSVPELAELTRAETGAAEYMRGLALDSTGTQIALVPDEAGALAVWQIGGAAQGTAELPSRAPAAAPAVPPAAGIGPVPAYVAGHPIEGRGVAYLPRMDRVVLAGERMIRLFSADLQLEEILSDLPPSQEPLFLCADARTDAVLVGTDLGPPRLSEGGADRGGSQPLQRRGEQSASWCGDFSPDGRWVAVGFEDGSVAVWDRRSAACTCDVHPFDDWVAGVFFSEDSSEVRAVCFDGRFVRIEVPAGRTHDVVDLPAGATIGAAAITPDRRLLLGGHEALWALDAASGAQVAGPTDLGACVLSVAVSPEGRSLAVGVADGRIVLVELPSLERVGEVPVEQGDYASSLAFSPDGEYLAVTTHGPAPPHVWRVADLRGTALPAPREALAAATPGLRLPIGLTAGPLHERGDWDNWVQSAHFGPSGEIVVGHRGEGILVLSPDLRQRTLRVETPAPGASWHSALHPREPWVVTCDPDGGRAQVWNWTDGQRVHGMRGPIQCATFSHSGTLLALGASEGGRVSVRRVQGWRERAMLQVPGGQQHVACLAFSSDDELLAACCGGRVFVFGPVSRELVGQLAADEAAVPFAVFRPNSKELLVACHQAECFRLWDVEADRTVCEIRSEENSAPRVAAFGAGGRVVALGYAGGLVELRRSDTWELLAARETGADVWGLDFNADDTSLMVAGEDVLQIWGVVYQEAPAAVGAGMARAQAIATQPVAEREDFESRVEWAVPLPDDRIAVALHEGSVQFLDEALANRSRVVQLPGDAWAAEVDPGGQWIACPGTGGLFAPADELDFPRFLRRRPEDEPSGVVLVEVATNEATLLSQGWARPRFSPDGSLLALGDQMGTVRLFDLRQRALREPALSCQVRQPVVHLDFSPNGSHLAAILRDGTAAVWQVDTGALLGTIPGDELARIGGIALVSTSPATVVTAGTHRDHAQVWQLPGPTLVRDLQQQGRGAPSAVAGAPDGSLVAVGHESGEIDVYRCRDWSLAAALDLGGPVETVRFGAGGRFLVATSEQRVAVWPCDVSQRPAPAVPMTEQGANGSALLAQALVYHCATLARSGLRQDPVPWHRVAKWQRLAQQEGADLPLVVVRDFGLALAYANPAADRVRHGAEGADDTPPSNGAAADGSSGAVAFFEARTFEPLPGLPDTAHAAAYRDLLHTFCEHPKIERCATMRLNDRTVGFLLARLLGSAVATASPAQVGEPRLRRDLYRRLEWADTNDDRVLAQLAQEAQELWGEPVDVEVGRETLDRALQELSAQEVEFIQKYGHLPRDLGARERERMLGLLELPRVARALTSSVMSIVPSAVRQHGPASEQYYAVDAITGIARRGSWDSLVLSELAWPRDYFYQKLVDNELLYYGRERLTPPARHLLWVLCHTGLPMRGDPDRFARFLVLALRDLALKRGFEYQFSFFDDNLGERYALRDPDDIYLVQYFRSNDPTDLPRCLTELDEELRLLEEDYRKIHIMLVSHYDFDADEHERHADRYREIARRAELHGVLFDTRDHGARLPEVSQYFTDTLVIRTADINEAAQRRHGQSGNGPGGPP